MSRAVQLALYYPNLPPPAILAPTDALSLGRMCAEPPLDAAEIAAATGMSLAQWLAVIGAAPTVFERADGMNEAG